MKKIFFLSLIMLFSMCAGLFAQQIPKIGVINYSKLMQEFMPGSKAMDDVSQFNADYAAKVDSVNQEINKLVKQKDRILAGSGDEKALKKVQEQIDTRKKYLVEYEAYKDQVLASKKAQAGNLTSQVSKVLSEIQYIAESEGYSIIFDSNDKDIVWWSQSVDITDLVRSRLRK
ncbi:MAG: OmpH family outer membrane protein [Spirochaetia bacterium]|nr:OmpH family outer membrane protein [Spirochaetia bacterium]